MRNEGMFNNMETAHLINLLDMDSTQSSLGRISITRTTNGRFDVTGNTDFIIFTNLMFDQRQKSPDSFRLLMSW
jgi:hypothetical protein